MLEKLFYFIVISNLVCNHCGILASFGILSVGVRGQMKNPRRCQNAKKILAFCHRSDDKMPKNRCQKAKTNGDKMLFWHFGIVYLLVMVTKCCGLAFWHHSVNLNP